MSFRSPKLIRSAKGQRCVLCGLDCSGAAHANSVALGKGKGIKAPDYFTAWLCQRHHDMIDGRIPMQLGWGDPKELWLFAFAKTVEQWFIQGIVEVT